MTALRIVTHKQLAARPKRGRGDGAVATTAAATTTTTAQALTPPPPTAPQTALPLLREFDAQPSGMWLAYKLAGEEGAREQVFDGLDPEAGRRFASEMGRVVFALCTKPESRDKRFDKDVLAATDLLVMAKDDDSALLAFLFAAAGGEGELGDALQGHEAAERRRVLGTYTCFQIIQNLAHREKTAPLQEFFSRLIEVICHSIRVKPPTPPHPHLTLQVSGASDNARQVMRQMCLTTSRTGDWGVFAAGLPGEGELLHVGPDELLIVRCDKIGFKHTAVGHGAGYIQKTILLWIVIPREQLAEVGAFEADTTPRDLVSSPLTLEGDFAASRSDYNRLVVRDFEYCNAALALAAAALGRPLGSLHVGFEFPTDIPTAVSCHYKTNFDEIALTDVVGDVQGASLQSHIKVVDSTDRKMSAVTGDQPAFLFDARQQRRHDMYANSFVRNFEITPEDFAVAGTINNIVSRALSTAKLHPDQQLDEGELSVFGKVFITSDNSPYIQWCRQQALDPGPRANAMFHGLKAIVTFNNSLARPLWFAKLVGAWRPSPAQLDWVCEPVAATTDLPPIHLTYCSLAPCRVTRNRPSRRAPTFCSLCTSRRPASAARRTPTLQLRSRWLTGSWQPVA